jgi:PAS domain S-box-containing protein
MFAGTELSTTYNEVSVDGKIWKSEQIDCVYGNATGAFKVVCFHTKPKEMAFIFEDISQQKKDRNVLLESKEKYRLLSEGAFEAVVWHDNGRIIEANEQYYDMFGYQPNELAGKDAVSLTVAPNSLRLIRERIASGNMGPYQVEGLRKDGSTFPMEIRVKKMKYKGRTARMAAIRDMTEQIEAEAALKRRERQLKEQTRHLAEVNTAMKVLLKKREEDKNDLEERVLTNVKQLVGHYLEKLKHSGLNGRQKTYVDIIEANLNEIVSPFLQRLSSNYLALTPAEVRVADLIKQGKTSKEIAELFNQSPRTIEFHRDNIRKKMGLKNRKSNLRTHLLSM